MNTVNFLMNDYDKWFNKTWLIWLYIGTSVIRSYTFIYVHIRSMLRGVHIGDGFFNGFKVFKKMNSIFKSSLTWNTHQSKGICYSNTTQKPNQIKLDAQIIRENWTLNCKNFYMQIFFHYHIQWTIFNV